MQDAAHYEIRQPRATPKLLEAAAIAKPGAWVYEIDWNYPDDQRTPTEAIRAGWEVGEGGRLTGNYAPNSSYRPVEHSDRVLKPYMHAAARSNPVQWVVDIDPRGEHLFPAIPEELIRGWWYVDAQGKITDRFRPSSKWQPE